MRYKTKGELQWLWDGQALTRTSQCWKRTTYLFSEFSKFKSESEDWRCGKGRAVVRDDVEVLAYFELATQKWFEVAEGVLLQRAGGVGGLESSFKI